jgi:hypothetical protein
LRVRGLDRAHEHQATRTGFVEMQDAVFHVP